jgi:hypothetical protein
LKVDSSRVVTGEVLRKKLAAEHKIAIRKK